MKRLPRPFLACLLFAGCAAGPVDLGPAPGSRSGQPLAPLVVQGAASLTHEGGIVYGQTLDALKDAASRAEAATLQLELTLAVRVDRSMRVAELLAAAPAGFELLAKPDDPASGTARANGKGRGKAHDDAVRQAALGSLARDAAAFGCKGPDIVTPTADGGQAITASFDATGQGGPEQVDVTRTYDAEGELIAQRVHLDGAAASANRTQRFAADGSLDLEATLTLKLADGEHVVSWAPHAAADGALAGAGQIRRPDGTVVAVDVTGKVGEVARIEANDTAAGLKAALDAPLDAATGTLTIDAGARGAVKLELATGLL